MIRSDVLYSRYLRVSCGCVVKISVKNHIFAILAQYQLVTTKIGMYVGVLREVLSVS